MRCIVRKTASDDQPCAGATRGLGPNGQEQWWMEFDDLGELLVFVEMYSHVILTTAFYAECRCDRTNARELWANISESILCLELPSQP